MPETKEQIIARYRAEHSRLENEYYQKHSIDKKTFDLLHGNNWRDMEAELIAEGYRQPPIPARDLEAEIDELKAKIERLETIGIIGKT